MEAASPAPLYDSIIALVGESPLGVVRGKHLYYTYSQNNSGGHFTTDDNIGSYVIIAAKNANDANERARQIGVYFDGCSSGDDCSCCGDRWFEASDFDGKELPEIYGSSVEESIKDLSPFRESVVLHNVDGTRVTYMRKKSKR